MKRSSTTLGLIIAVIAASTFGLSGALIKPLLESGWSPAAAVTLRVLIGGTVLFPFAILSLRGRWGALWRGRWHVLGMALIGVSGTQLMYFAAIQRIPVGTAILLEYLAPLLLVAFVWIRTRRMPRAVVLIGSVIAMVGLVLVVSPGGGGPLDPLGILFGLLAAVGVAFYYLLAARPSQGLPSVALAGAGLTVGSLILGLIGLIGIVPFDAPAVDVPFFGMLAPWWVPLLVVGVVATAIAYATSIRATELLGSRLASFVGLLEVVAAALYAWLLLGENLTIPQLLGGVLILTGIVFVRMEKEHVEPIFQHDTLAEPKSAVPELVEGSKRAPAPASTSAATAPR